MAYTTIDNSEEHFQTTLYTGAGAGQTVTNDGNSNLQPDLLWIKRRNAAYAHFVVDSNRNISYAQNSSNAPYLETNSTAAENNNQNWMQSVNTDGFTTGISEHINSTASSTFVAWAWKANGGTTSSNGDGSITSTVQADTTAGFSIVTYTGNSNSPSSIGHGLGAVPKFYIIKQRDAANAWVVYHSGLATTDPEDYAIELNQSAARENKTIWNDTGPTSSVINFTDHGAVNNSGDTYVAYCFAEKQGYSKFGQYTGNGSAEGPFVYTGFKPAFLLIKSREARNWLMYDNKRGAFNLNDEYVYANEASAEATSSTSGYDFLSNGFKVRNTYNDGNVSSEVYTFTAFAENPFVTSTGIPTTAR